MSPLARQCKRSPLSATTSLSPLLTSSPRTLLWDQWNSAHSGPVLDYIARCPNDDCSTFKGDSGAVWVKIGQLAYNPNAAGQPWASDFLRERGAKWDVTIPSGLAPGSYLLRHEILGLHVAGQRFGAQFYPSCTHINIIQGGSTSLPSGVALPGAYDPDDTQGVSHGFPCMKCDVSLI